MVHVLSASVFCEDITARGSVNACQGCPVFEGFHFRHYFPLTCRNSTCFYGCTLFILSPHFSDNSTDCTHILSLSDSDFRLRYDKAPGCCNGWRISCFEKAKTMTNEPFFGLGSVGTVGVNVETAIGTFIYWLANVFLTCSFRRLIVELLTFLSRGLVVGSYLDCFIFGLLIKLQFRRRQKKPPDKLCNLSSSWLSGTLSRRNQSSSWFRLW